MSQIAPRRQPIKVKEPKSSRKTNTSHAQNECERLCEASLYEAINNFKTSSNMAILELPLSTIAKRNWLSNTNKRNNFVKNLDQIQDKIKMSYVSCDTFQENKVEPIHDGNKSAFVSNNRKNYIFFVPQLMEQLNQSTFKLMQIRGFKTHRNIKSQLKRNPTLLSRFQKTLRK